MATDYGKGEVVCVTGGSGYIGSCLLCLLLQRGYTVHATVKDLGSHPLLSFTTLYFRFRFLKNYLIIICAGNEKETKHLLALEGAESRLLLFEMDLLNYGSIVAAMTGTTGVFHLASPNTIDKVPDPEVNSYSPGGWSPYAIPDTSNSFLLFPGLCEERDIEAGS